MNATSTATRIDSTYSRASLLRQRLRRTSTSPSARDSASMNASSSNGTVRMVSRRVSSSSWSFSRSLEVSSRMMAFSLWWRICSASSRTCTPARRGCASSRGCRAGGWVGELSQRQPPSHGAERHAGQGEHCRCRRAPVARGRRIEPSRTPPSARCPLGGVTAPHEQAREDEGRSANHTAQYVKPGETRQHRGLRGGEVHLLARGLARGALLLRRVLASATGFSSASSLGSGSPSGPSGGRVSSCEGGSAFGAAPSSFASSASSRGWSSSFVAKSLPVIAARLAPGKRFRTSGRVARVADCTT